MNLTLCRYLSVGTPRLWVCLFLVTKLGEGYQGDQRAIKFARSTRASKRIASRAVLRKGEVNEE